MSIAGNKQPERMSLGITIQDGPAVGLPLSLRRAPKLLRIVRSSRGNWDALDQVTDTPNAQETIHVYQRVGLASGYHMSCRPRSAGGWFASATYRVVDPQPAESDTRDTAAWQAWCERVAPALFPDGDLK